MRLLNDRYRVMQELLDILRVHVQVRRGHQGPAASAMPHSWAALGGPQQAAVGRTEPAGRQPLVSPGGSWLLCLPLAAAARPELRCNLASPPPPPHLDTPQKSYYSRLEAAVMWLVGVCAVVAVAQLVALAFWEPPWRH